MTRRIELVAGEARATVLPDLGGALASLSVAGLPVLRPSSGEVEPFAAASIVLAPYSNRVSRPFVFRGATHTLPRNLPSEAFPLHGDAFLRRWTVVACEPARIGLALPDGGSGPLLYSARLRYSLSPGALSAELTLTSRAAAPLPFGLGFHPWFPRDEATRFQFEARAIWPEDARHLPAADRPTPIPLDLDFATARPLPSAWINNGFAGWDGTLRVEQGKAAVSVALRASANLNTLLIYSPSATAGFVCAEPVSHPVDAFNLPGQPGLVVLDPQETLRARMDIEWPA